MNLSNPESDSLLFLRGFVSRVTYHSADTGYAVLQLEPDKDLVDRFGEKTTVVGRTSGEPQKGTYLIVKGDWTEHPKFGRQFAAKSISTSEPRSCGGIARYLASGAIKGIGPVLAERLIEAFGEETLKVIEEQPELLRDVEGVGEKKLDEITDSFKKGEKLRDLQLFFEEHQISTGVANRLIKKFGDGAIEAIKANPWGLIEKVHGIGFLTADRIALKTGHALDSPARMKAGLVETLSQALKQGHCLLEEEDLFSNASKILGQPELELLKTASIEIVDSGLAAKSEEYFYLKDILVDEQLVAEQTAERIDASGKNIRAISKSDIRHVQSDNIRTPAGDLLSLSEEQKQALSLLENNSLLLITGGPGCGKTTLVQSICRLFSRVGIGFKLAAPTGRAAHRLGEVCGHEASTIHRLLKYDPFQGVFTHNAKDPIETDALIIDESSMLDINLASSLFDATSDSTRLILIGDADQIPSVGPGLVFANLLDSPKIPKIRLTRIFRRSGESSITDFAHEINEARVPQIPIIHPSTDLESAEKPEAVLIQCKDPEEAATKIESLVTEMIPQLHPDSGQTEESGTMVLSPMNRGELGIVSLNQRLQEAIVKQRVEVVPESKYFVRCGPLKFHLGDRVVQRQNNYNLHTAGVFNGDQGKVIGIDPDKKELHVKLWDGRKITYDQESLPQLDLGYALTIHRAQGSEAKVVVLALHDSHGIMLDRQLLYTAITRAKKQLYIIGTKRALITSTKRSRSKNRNTRLRERIVRILGSETQISFFGRS